MWSPAYLVVQAIDAILEHVSTVDERRSVLPNDLLKSPLRLGEASSLLSVEELGEDRCTRRLLLFWQSKDLLARFS